MTPQDHLTAFYKSLQAWIDDGCPDNHRLYGRRVGICVNLGHYFHDAELSATAEDAIADLLGEQFIAAGLDSAFPFSGGEYAGYRKDEDACAMYTNPARLAWIKARAGE